MSKNKIKRNGVDKTVGTRMRDTACILHGRHFHDFGKQDHELNVIHTSHIISTQMSNDNDNTVSSEEIL